MNMDVKVDVQYATEETDLPDKEALTQWVNAVLLTLSLQTESTYLQRQISSLFSQKDELELTIRIVDEAEASQLNETWRQSIGPTNVLSFPFECPPGVDIPLLGDIVICATLVAREALKQQKSLQAHWAHLVIHGTLHLLGYDHISDSQAEIMENLEIRVLDHLGYPNPY